MSEWTKLGDKMVFGSIPKKGPRFNLSTIRFVGKPEGVSNVILTYFDYFCRMGGQCKVGGSRGTRGGLTPPPPVNRVLISSIRSFAFQIALDRLLIPRVFHKTINYWRPFVYYGRLGSAGVRHFGHRCGISDTQSHS